ncbi:hypothetical protein [Pontibacter pudoricolor]|uniref:hypothetical protein n=1 Tax=Pontibacter pudoricolor TaxID=2694930 RepID=UPI001390D244|nr:hypothetical protein [Pontibacter pudoricolor]
MEYKNVKKQYKTGQQLSLFDNVIIEYGACSFITPFKEADVVPDYEGKVINLCSYVKEKKKSYISEILVSVKAF